MKSSHFCRLALSFPETAERVHVQHPDFRVAGKIFATLGYPTTGSPWSSSLPLKQEIFVKAQPGVFVPVVGAWGRRGCTNVRLKSARKPTGAPRPGSRLASCRASETRRAILRSLIAALHQFNLDTVFAPS